MKKIPEPTAAALDALRRLVVGVCQAREDGPELLQTLQQGRLRIVFDEGTALVTIGTVDSDGKVAWVDTVHCDPTIDRHFGLVANTALDGAVSH